MAPVNPANNTGAGNNAGVAPKNNAGSGAATNNPNSPSNNLGIGAAGVGTNNGFAPNNNPGNGTNTPAGQNSVIAASFSPSEVLKNLAFCRDQSTTALQILPVRRRQTRGHPACAYFLRCP